jgi:hypothetical protein
VNETTQSKPELLPVGMLPFVELVREADLLSQRRERYAEVSAALASASDVETATRLQSELTELEYLIERSEYAEKLWPLRRKQVVDQRRDEVAEQWTLQDN